jgi:acetyl esterase
MRLDPAIRQFVDANASERLEHLDIPEQRRYMRLLTDLNFLRFSRPGPDVHSSTEHVVAVDGGKIRCRVYRPSDESVLPAHVALHGGGWWQGSIDDLICDAICRQRCVEAHVVVIAVGYRLAPEYPFPTGLNDAYTALSWLAEHAAELHVDADNVSVGGSSAGGNLAAALAVKARDSGGPPVAFQLLEVPALDLTLATSRHTAATVEAQDMADELDVAVDRYLADPRQAAHPLASPLLAEDLCGLPPAVIFTAEYDPLRADGERYASRLNSAGTPARAIPHRGALHGTALLTRTWPAARTWHREAAAALREAHWSSSDAAAS